MGYDIAKIITANESFNRRLASLFGELIDAYRRINFAAQNFAKIAPHEYPIWFFWWQGRDNMPPIPRLCLNSLLYHAPKNRVRLLDRHNYREFLDLPSFLLDKVAARKLSLAQFSDIIRVALLEKYGGLWMDSTILTADDLDRHPEIFGKFYTRKCAADKNENPAYAWCISYYRWSGYFMGTNIKQNPLFSFVKDAFLAYWQNYSQPASYLMIDYLINLAYENIPFVQREMDAVPINNLGMTVLGDQRDNHLNDPFEPAAWEELNKNTFLHKLSWKNDIKYAARGTYYHELRSRYGLYRSPNIDKENLVSFVMVCQNNGEEIMAAARRLTEQTWLSAEIIIVDDGSEDEVTKKILHELDDIPSVKVLCSMPYGHSAACALGRESALGETVILWRVEMEITKENLSAIIAVGRENKAASRRGGE